MKRREFMGLVGGAAAWPVAARAQQPAMPVIGWLHPTSSKEAARYLRAFHKGLREAGYVEGQNVAIEYRWAEGKNERLPALVGELVRRPVALILAATPAAAMSAKVATTTIPIVFTVGFDPVAAGLVTSLNRPSGNATGMTLLTGPLVQKRLEFLRELLSKAAVIAMLVNPTGPDAVPEIRDAHAAAQANGMQIKLLNASTMNEIEGAFTSLADLRPDALVVGSDPFFLAKTEEFADLTARIKIPTIFPFREFTASGGLASYGTSVENAYRQAGIYVARILRGESPADLPVQQPTKFDLVLNLKTAKALGLNVPLSLIARADEVIE